MLRGQAMEKRGQAIGLIVAMSSTSKKKRRSDYKHRKTTPSEEEEGPHCKVMNSARLDHVSSRCDEKGRNKDTGIESNSMVHATDVG